VAFANYGGRAARLAYTRIAFLPRDRRSKGVLSIPREGREEVEVAFGRILDFLSTYKLIALYGHLMMGLSLKHE
jgi:hypothetical protein